MLTMIKKNTMVSTAFVLLSIVTVAAFVPPAMATDLNYRVTNTQHLDGDIRWDYLTFDADHQRLFITRGDHVDVFDLATKTVTAMIPNTNGVHGVALAPALNKGFTSNGKDNSVTIFELSSLKIVGTVPVGKKPDAIIFDSFSQRVFVANGDSMNLTVIDAVSQKILGTIMLDGKPEFTAVDGKGKLFVNVEDKNQLVSIDTQKMNVLKKIDLTSVCDEPAGLSIDTQHEILFSGCHNQKMAIVDGQTGKIIGSPAIGKGSDATVYDQERQLAFSSNGDGTLTVVGVDAKNTYVTKQTVKTMVTARTMALDTVSHNIYLVAAELDVPAKASENQRPKLKPESFTLITVSSN